MPERRRPCAAALLCTLLVLTASRAWCEQTIHLYTEVFPPYSMTVDGSAHTSVPENVSGFATDIVKELLRRAQVPYTLELVPWKRAYDKALMLENHGVFSTTRTPEREALFQWVGPIAENNWVFMAVKDSPITLDSLEQASAYRIGGYLEDAIADYLVEQGLDVEYVPNDVLNVRKLARGRIDLWPVGQLKGPQLAATEGVEVKEIYVIKRTQMGLAMNADTDPALVERLNHTLEQMRADGTVHRITRDFLAAPQPASEAPSSSATDQAQR